MSDAQWAVPDGLRYHPEHLWVREEGPGRYAVGLTDYLQDTAGAVMFVQVPREGTALTSGEQAVTLESAKWVGHFPSPVGGRVAAVNGLLAADPGVVNRDPYGEGWLFRVEGAAPAEGLLAADEYRSLLARLAREEAAW